MHRRLSGRAVQDLHLTDLVFELAQLRMSRDEADVLVEKLELIHEFANPPEEPSGGRAPEDEDEGRPDGLHLTRPVRIRDAGER